MKTQLSICELQRLTTAELKALRGFLFERLTSVPQDSPLREDILKSLTELARVLSGRRFSGQVRGTMDARIFH